MADEREIIRSLSEIQRGLGKVEGELFGLNQRMDKSNGNVADLSKVVTKLPCVKHSGEIKTLMEFAEHVKSQSIRRSDRSFKLRLVAISAGISSGVSILIWYLNQFF